MHATRLDSTGSGSAKARFAIDSRNRVEMEPTPGFVMETARYATPRLAAPHYIVWTEAGAGEEDDLWRFVVKTPSGRSVLEAADREPQVRGERLELLAAVRGLEALERPSQVVLVTASRYVRRGLAFGLENWRSNGWRWESYGQMVPVKNVDLWQRLDRAIAIHQVQSGGARYLHRSHAAPEVQEPSRMADRVRNAYRRLRRSAGNGIPAPHCRFGR